jgi:hypothetical protein
LLLIPGVRSLDLHRYRVRVNLERGGGRQAVSRRAIETLRDAWGEPVALAADQGPRAFGLRRRGERRVAESPDMATASHESVLIALFAVEGVTEAIAGEDLVLVRLGRLFRWEDVEPAVGVAIRPFATPAGPS